MKIKFKQVPNLRMNNKIFNLNLTNYDICIYSYIILNDSKPLSLDDIKNSCKISLPQIYKCLKKLISCKLINKISKNIYKIEKITDNYFKFPKYLFSNNLDSFEISTLLYFFKLHNFDEIFPNQKTIAKKLNISRSKVNNIISSLTKKGFIIKFRRFKKTSIYKIIMKKFKKRKILSKRQYKSKINNIINNIINFEKKHSAINKNQKINYTVPENIYYKLKELKDNFDKKYNTNLSLYLLKVLFKKYNLEILIYYFKNLDKFLKWKSIKNIAAYFYKIVNNQYDIPVQEQINIDDTIQEEIKINQIEYNYVIKSIENDERFIEKNIEYSNDFITLIKQRRYNRFNFNENTPSTT